MPVTHTCVQCNFHKHTSGIIRKNSVSGSSSGSQERNSKGVTFATDYARIVSVTTELLFTFIDYYLSAPLFFGLFFTPINGILILDARCTDLPFIFPTVISFAEELFGPRPTLVMDWSDNIASSWNCMCEHMFVERRVFSSQAVMWIF